MTTGAASGGATVVVSRRVRAEESAGFQRWIRRLRRTIQRAPGFVDLTVHPPNANHPDEWIVLYQFESPRDLDDWLQSAARMALIAESETYLVDRPIEQRIVAPTSGTVTLISAVRLRPGTEDAHHHLHSHAVAAAQRLGGLIRHELVPAVAGAQPETVALLTFQSRTHLDRWLSAPERRRILDAMADLTEGPRTLNVVGDFAGWFNSTGAWAPKRWKQAIAVVIGLVPVSFAVTLIRQATAPQLPLLAAVAITAVVNVVVMTWLVMPLITRILRRWLTQ